MAAREDERHLLCVRFARKHFGRHRDQKADVCGHRRVGVFRTPETTEAKVTDFARPVLCEEKILRVQVAM